MINNGVTTALEPVEQRLLLEGVQKKSTENLVEQKLHKLVEYCFLPCN